MFEDVDFKEIYKGTNINKPVMKLIDQYLFLKGTDIENKNK